MNNLAVPMTLKLIFTIFSGTLHINVEKNKPCIPSYEVKGIQRYSMTPQTTMGAFYCFVQQSHNLPSVRCVCRYYN